MSSESAVLLNGDILLDGTDRLEEFDHCVELILLTLKYYALHQEGHVDGI